MSSRVRIEITVNFKREAKKLLKKFPSLTDDLGDLMRTLESNPIHGTPLGNNIFKIRLAIKSKGKGKSGGARVITYVQPEVVFYVGRLSEKVTIVSLITIYDKSEVASIPVDEIKGIITDLKLGRGK